MVVWIDEVYSIKITVDRKEINPVKNHINIKQP